MELPVCNKTSEIRYRLNLGFLILILVPMAVSIIGRAFVGPILGLTLLGWLIISVQAIRENMIRQVFLNELDFEIYHRTGVIRVPKSKVKKFSSAKSHSLDLKAHWPHIVTIEFREEYAFGTKIKLKYIIMDANEYIGVAGEPKVVSDLRKVVMDD